VSAWRRGLCTLIWSTGWIFELAGRGLAHFAAGTLSLADLRATIAEAWEHFGRREEDILSGLMPWEQECYARFLRPQDRILLIGCGTGRDLIALLRGGHRVEGMDSAVGAVTIARQMLDRLGLSTELYTGSIETFPLPGEFDVFAFSWLCYGYIPQSRTRRDVLGRLAAHLRPGGRIIVSYFPTPSHSRLPILLTQLGGWVTRSDWRAEPGDRVWISLPRRQTLHYQHEFVDGEFDAEAEAAGLRLTFQARKAEGVAVLTSTAVDG
jgi:SAM-dependent methyltransferase